MDEKDLDLENKKEKSSKTKMTKEEKAKIKFEKIEAKRIKKEKQREIYKNLQEGYKDFESKDNKIKRAKEQKIKKAKEKIDFRTAIREFPVRIAKEVQKVRWPKQKDLGIKLSWVIGFMFVLAAIFYFVDWAIQSLFVLCKII